MLQNRLRLAALSLCLLAPVAAHATPYTSIYVFGDSLSDGGSVFQLSTAIHGLNPAFPIVPAAPQDFGGRWGNGKVAVDYLADRIGVSLTAHYKTPLFLGGLTGGNNYAQGGATSGAETASLPGTLTIGSSTVATGFKGLTGEIADYKATTATADPNAVYVVWAGANDFLSPGATAILPSCIASPNPAICTGVSNIANSVAVLAAMGAKHILVPNLPDLGKTASAFAAGPAYQAGAHALTVGFNGALAAALGGLSGLYPGFIVPFDTFSYFDSILASASSYGFVDTTHQCLTGSAQSATSVISAACAAAGGPDAYVFWDGIHPTSHAQLLLANAFAVALAAPEPSDFALLGLGLIALVAARRRSRKN